MFTFQTNHGKPFTGVIEKRIEQEPHDLLKITNPDTLKFRWFFADEQVTDAPGVPA